MFHTLDHLSQIHSMAFGAVAYTISLILPAAYITFLNVLRHLFSSASAILYLF